MNERQLFQQHVAPTSPEPMALPITKAEGSFLYDDNNKKYIDLIGGISVCNIGHCHPKVVAAIQHQATQYLHVMVYGEVIQSPQVQYATLITKHLPSSLDCVYFVNSGAEAVDGAMKLAKRYTGRPEIIACHNSYHGSTQGALSIMGDESFKNPYRPLLPNITHVWHNNFESLAAITNKTAAIILEPIQAEGGILVPQKEWMQALRKKCDETGTLLILDEIQTGFGRTGKLWAFEHFDIIPDVLMLGKALGGGMPMGAFIAKKEIMDTLSYQPILGHMTTFGGHPVCCAAGMASMQVILEDNLVAGVQRKETLFINNLKHEKIVEIRHIGLMMAVVFDSFETTQKVIKLGLEAGFFSDWFLFAPNAIRIVPPLNMQDEIILEVCKKITSVLDKL